jgi:protein-disulfide isomerase
VASRKQQKEAARQAREQRVAQMKAAQSRRTRMSTLSAVVVGVIIAAGVFILVSSSGGGGPASQVLTQRDGAGYSHAGAQANVASLLDGIPQHGNVLGNPNAPITITEFGDLVCSSCDDWDLTSEPQLITQYVRTGKVQLQYRGVETSSGYYNGGEYVATQVAARAAGLQNKEWNYIVLLYDEQPRVIGGKSAELVKYVSSTYLLNRAQQLAPYGLNVAEWKRHLNDPTLIQDVTADTAAATQMGVSGTPTIFISGPKGTVQYDKGATLPSVVPTIQQLAALIAQVS